MKTFPTNRFMSLRDAAILTGYSEGHLRRLLREGQLLGEKLSERLWLVDAKAAQRLAKKPYTFGRPKKSL